MDFFTFLIVWFESQKFFIFIKSNLLFFSFVVCVFDFMQIYPCVFSQDFYSFSSYITFRSLTHFELVLYTVYRPNFILLHVSIQLSQYYLPKRLSFPTELSWHLCQISVDHKHISLFLDSIILHLSIYLSYAVPYCLDNCCFVLSFEIRNVNPHILFFSFKIILSILGSLEFHMNFRITLSTSIKKPLNSERDWI